MFQEVQHSEFSNRLRHRDRWHLYGTQNSSTTDHPMAVDVQLYCSFLKSFFRFALEFIDNVDCHQ